MANSYFNHTSRFAEGTLVRAEAVNSVLDAIAAGFDALPDLGDIVDTYAEDIGVANAYVIELDPAPATLGNVSAEWLVGHNNTGASTLEVVPHAAKEIKRFDGSALKLGDLKAGMIARTRYDGTVHRLVGVHGSDQVAAAASAAAAAASAVTAAGHVTTAAGHVATALTHANAADTAKTAAQTAKGLAETAESNAEGYAFDAELASTAAEAAQTAAEAARDAALAAAASIAIALTPETGVVVAGTTIRTYRMPYDFTLTAVRASLATAQTSGNILTVDINEAGASILSTKLTIDNNEKSSVTAFTPAVISDTALADNAEITVDVDQVGNGTAKGLIVYLIGRKT